MNTINALPHNPLSPLDAALQAMRNARTPMELRAAAALVADLRTEREKEAARNAYIDRCSALLEEAVVFGQKRAGV